MRASHPTTTHGRRTLSVALVLNGQLLLKQIRSIVANSLPSIALELAVRPQRFDLLDKGLLVSRLAV